MVIGAYTIYGQYSIDLEDKARIVKVPLSYGFENQFF